MTSTSTTTLKYHKKVKFNKEKFSIVNISDKHDQNQSFNIRGINGKYYVYLPERSILSNHDLEQGAIYSVRTQDNHFSRYHKLIYHLSLIMNEQPNPKKVKKVKCLL